MIKKIIILFLGFNNITVFADELLGNQIFSPVTESRRALQSNNREIEKLSEKNQTERLIKNNEEKISAKNNNILPDSNICLKIDNVFLQGITLLDKDDLNKITALPLKCITANNLNNLARELTQLYINKGYITSRVEFIQPNARGELGVQVIEGFVEGIKGGDRKVNSNFIFPNIINNPLKLKDLDQGLDQANRLQSNQVTLDILPGKYNGGSIIVLSNKYRSPWSATASLDNYGQENTGKWLSRATFSIDSPLGISDFISLNTSTTLKSYSNKYSRAYNLFYSVPYGNLTFSSFYSYSEYLIKQHLKNTLITLNGNTQQYGIKSDYLYYRDQNDLFTISAQLTNKQVKNLLLDSLLFVSSPELTVLDLSLNHTHIFPTSVLNSNLSIEKGLSIFNFDKKRNIINNEFSKLKLSFNYSYSFNVFDSIYQLNNQLFAQYSPHALPGVEWLSLTDRFAVRGFSQTSISGDNGWFSHNTLSNYYFINNTVIHPRLGVDIGQVYPHGDSQSNFIVLGLSTGMSLNYKKFIFDMDISHGKILSGLVSKNEPMTALFNVTYKI
ncbi:hypothetical protein UA38_11190 [Photobacterium kishitanii]|uniref:Hemolysin activation protein n=2 Tax=Photobacterium kishitanii TaxID=318456 RepID=A0AAX0YPB9_9GAMM|nr:ShlB/FhaC/HecB family hemolysin secretion/activation protein [Photobacterium kishitanii]KJG57137.1 hypothetical protein UA38_11190 [Photobacterium kishitanii]KJG60460.1 hypothetical protein UA42_14995 [Photobacterium kishitanii]KJG64754.1 hypothetical protein UA40_14695 [Photobacterium kishitanii]KJG68952.1 hypothetical protein UA41_13830 [Photobacterium kishitanii]PSX15921.1 hemolysin activation protein [Photobacterium kishitanii]